jgi:hypothetical protein
LCVRAVDRAADRRPRTRSPPSAERTRPPRRPRADRAAAPPRTATMRFAAELVAHAAQRMNPLGEREISLRGYKIAAIENTGTLKDG